MITSEVIYSKVSRNLIIGAQMIKNWFIASVLNKTILNDLNQAKIGFTVQLDNNNN